MEFHLNFPITPFPEPINYKQKLMFIGSCFSENIGELMQQHKFKVNINPNGVLFNPISISKALYRIIKKQNVCETDLFLANECWNNWDFHSRFSTPDKAICLNQINASISKAADFIEQADWLFITFGSAHTYTLNDSDTIVGNCHKVPQKQFSKKLLTTNEIVSEYTELIARLKKHNPTIKIVFTVSPVRYIRDGVVENNLSKARLIEAVHQLENAHNNTFYFPAYELVIDDLRDYRFYKSDMVHPNQQAIEYVFDHLINTNLDKESLKILDEIKNIISAKNHRPFNVETKAHQQFKNTYLKRCNELISSYPFLDLKPEMEYFKNK